MTHNDRDMRNEQGQTLTEFLEAYRPGNYERPAVTVDMALFTQQNGDEGGELLLIQRRNHPNIGKWALPGGFIEMKESLYESALRELQEETGVTGMPLHSLGMFGEPSRDPRMRIITAAFAAELPRPVLLPKIQAGDDAADARLFRWELNSLGSVEIPPQRGEHPALRLPCSATGEPHADRGQGYLLALHNGDIRLSARLALSDDGVTLLLATPDPARQGDGALAGDHGLMIFSALQALGKTRAL